MNFSRFAAIVSVAFLMIQTEVHAFKLSPQGTSIERALVRKDQRLIDRAISVAARSGIDKLGEPVHEEITNRMLGCDGDPNVCAEADWDSGAAYILAGVRWNDDPPFEFAAGHGAYRGCKVGNIVRLVTFTDCWVQVFNDGKLRASKRLPLDRRTAPILIRSHFGDLQFFHAMASTDGEAAAETQSKIMMWMEFTWKIAIRKIRVDEIVVDVGIAGMKDVFLGHGWSVQDVFAQGNPHIRKPKYLADVAFGSLLHVVQDSFSTAHVRREKPVHSRMCESPASERAAPGRIVEFHSYVNQDERAHGSEDTRQAFLTHWSDVRPSVVDIGRVLNEYYEKQVDWDVVRPYLTCVFQLSPMATP